MWQDTTESDGGFDERIEFFVTADGQLQVTGRDALDFEIFGGVSGQLEDFSRQVFKNGGNVDGSW